MLKKHINPGTVLYTFHSRDFLQSGYLFGTMHVSDVSAFSFYDIALEAMSKCSLLATEIDLDIGSSYDIQALLQLPEGQSLENLYSIKRYNKMKAIIRKAFKLDVEPFSKFLPLFILNVITEQELMQSHRKSLDMSIWQQAVEWEMERTGLENFNEHYQVLSQISPEYQAQVLYKITQNVSRFRKSMLNLTKQYEVGNLEALFRTTKKSLGKMRHVMLYDRNEIICNSIEELSVERKVFAAMGASHLWGKKGVIAGMKKRGYVLKPVFR